MRRRDRDVGPSAAEQVVSSPETVNDPDLELVETHGQWTLTLTRPLTDLADASTLRVRIRPNLVPSVPFDAAVILAEGSPTR